MHGPQGDEKVRSRIDDRRQLRPSPSQRNEYVKNYVLRVGGTAEQAARGAVQHRRESVVKQGKGISCWPLPPRFFGVVAHRALVRGASVVHI